MHIFTDVFSLKLGYTIIFILISCALSSAELRNCTADPDGDPLCNSRGDCIQSPTGSKSCTCVSGWTGVRCETNTTSNPQCMPGYDKATMCNTSTCKDAYVKNNMTSYECVCYRGFRKYTSNSTGACHDEDECKLYPGAICKHNGTCINKPGSYDCNCTSHYTGVNCTISVPTSCDGCDDNSNSTPIIVGCIIGGLVLLAAIGVAIYLFKRTPTTVGDCNDTAYNERFQRALPNTTHKKGTTQSTSEQGINQEPPNNDNDVVHGPISENELNAPNTEKITSNTISPRGIGLQAVSPLPPINEVN